MENTVTTDNITTNDKLTSLETRAASLEIRLRNIEAVLTEMQHGIVQSSIGLSGLVKLLISKNIINEKEVEKEAEKIHSEMVKEYELSNKDAQTKNPTPEEVKERKI